MNHETRAVRLIFAGVIAVTSIASYGTALADDVATVYSQRCAACHGTTGKGDGPAGKFLTPRPSDFAASLKGKTDDWMAKAIKAGGAAVGESPTMPPYPDLSDARVKGLVAYIRHLNP